MTDPEKPSKDDDKLVPPETPRSFKPGEEGGYQADPFSRNDQQGELALEPGEEASEGGGTSSVEATPDADAHKAGDDADSRDAPPEGAGAGGSR